MKLLVVEDEVYSRKSLVKQLRDFDRDAQFEIYEAENGREALKIFHELRPDLVLSDIKMPFVSGLELLRKIAEEHSGTKVVMISGYADFQFAQEALNAGAAGYLLKPVDDRQLYDCLEKVCQQSSHQKKLEEELSLLNHTDTLANYLFDCISSGVIREDFVNGTVFTRMMTPYRIAAISFSTGSYPEGAEFQKFLRDFLSGNLRAEYRTIMFSRKKWLVVVKEYDQVVSAMRMLSAKLRRAGWSYAIGVSAVHKPLRELLAAHAEAASVLAYRLTEPKNHLFCYEEAQAEHPASSVSFGQGDKLLFYLEKRDADNAFALLEKELLRMRENPQLPISCYESLLTGLTLAAQRTADPRFPQTKVTISLEACDSFDELLAAVRHVVDSVCLLGKSTGKAEDGSIVDRVLDYVDQNYNKDISLKELAETVFFLNHTYLSHLIREKTGKNYGCYLREVRIRHAKELLGDQNLSITEVASLSGYNDSSQFIQVFKKEEGVTPKKYRETLGKIPQ